MKNKALIMAIAFMAAACDSQPAQEKVPAIDLANIDTTVAPGQDFYAYATAGWQRNHPLKKEYSRYGSFDILRENNEIRLNELFKGLTELKTKKGSVEQKIADLYTMGLDSLRLNKEGAAPVMPYLQELEAVCDAESFAKAIGKLALYGENGAWGAGVDADLMDSNNNALYLAESGLGLGNRDYYLNEDNASLREGYEKFLTNVFSLAGYQNAAEKAGNAMSFEMAIAVPYWSMVQQRNYEAMYNPMSFSEIFAAYPHLHLDLYFAELGLADQEKVIVMQPSYFEALDKIVASADGAVLRDYLQAQLLSSACGSLSDDFTEASFEFFSKQMAGIQEQKPRWKRAMKAPNGILGEAVGQMYVKKYYGLFLICPT